MNHIFLFVKYFPFHSALACLLPVLLISSNINEIRDNKIHPNMNELAYATTISMLPSALSILPVLDAFWLKCFVVVLPITLHIWAKPPPSLSFDLGVIETFETKVHLEALDLMRWMMLTKILQDACCLTITITYSNLLFRKNFTTKEEPS
jgi:hypothetical protein